MTPDDPRHGTVSGYRNFGCRCEACHRAQMLRQKLYRMGRCPRNIPSLGTRRRIQSLVALGYNHAYICREVGHSRNWVHQLYLREVCRENIAAKVASVYNRLCMTPPPERTKRERQEAGKARALARRKGWPPPLAWTNIDDPEEQPEGWEYQERKRVNGTTADLEPIDPNVIDRILNGEWRLPASPLERVEIARIWVADGGSVNELSRRTGWKVERYVKVRDDEEAA